MTRTACALAGAARGRRRGREAAAMLLAAWLAGAAGCGGPQRASQGGDSPGPGPIAGPPPADAADPRTPIERRRDAACDRLAPRITACAIEDARADLTSGKIDQRQFERDTAPEVQRKHTEQFEKACKGARYSSRQVRVLEVCDHEETRCGPLLDCLGHLSDRPAAAGGK